MISFTLGFFTGVGVVMLIMSKREDSREHFKRGTEPTTPRPKP